MTWVVVIFSGSWAKRVIGPMSKNTAEALALGIGMRSSGSGGGENAVAVPLEAP